MPYETQVENFTTHCCCGHSGPFCRTCTQALSRRSARPALTPPPRGWSGNRWTLSSRRRSRRSRRRGRVSGGRRVIAAALHREEPGEAEHEEVEGAHHLVGEVDSETRASGISLPKHTELLISANSTWLQCDASNHLYFDMPCRRPFCRRIQIGQSGESFLLDEISLLSARSTIWRR